MADSLGDRMKNIEGRTRYMLPRRCYTLLRIDGKAFHTFVKTSNCEKPFDRGLMSAMQETTKYLCENIQGCKIGYTQSDEISLVLTDFDTMTTDAWFDGNIQKITSISASMATAKFNSVYSVGSDMAMFDSRVWTTSDPWEVFNTFLWRQQDATKNSIQMVARSVASHKECQNKKWADLNELIFSKGQNFNDYPVDCKRGSFVIKSDGKWIVDRNAPIISMDRDYFFNNLPQIPQYVTDVNE